LSHVSRALSRAHENGVVHRDLKPENIFIVRNDDEEIAKVLDFGIAKSQGSLGADSATRTGAVMGTPYYMSPEQISGAKNVDFRADLWALGVIACECLTGRRPFEAESVGGLALRICVEPLPQPSILAAVPAGFDGWFERAVARDPSLRFNSARELAEQLRQVCGSSAPPLGSARDQSYHAPPAGTAAMAGVSVPSTSALSRTSNDGSAGVRRGHGRWFALAGALGLSAVAVAAWFRLSASERTAANVSVASAASAAPPDEPRVPTTSAVPATPPASAVPSTSSTPIPTAAASVPPPAPVPLPTTPRALPKATAKHATPSANPPATTSAEAKQAQAPTTTTTATPKLDARSVINSRR